MTLDEAIKHAEEVAEENQAIVDACDYYGDNMAKCDKCAEDHRQLARWLKDYKRLLKESEWHKETHNEDISKNIAIAFQFGLAMGFAKKCDESCNVNKESCCDAISRAEAIKRFTYNYKGEHIPDYDCDNFPVQIDMKTVKEILRELPSVNLQPKTGHWIDADGDNAICGCCNRLNHLYGTYCKYCGAKMEESEG